MYTSDVSKPGIGPTGNQSHVYIYKEKRFIFSYWHTNLHDLEICKMQLKITR